MKNFIKTQLYLSISLIIIIMPYIRLLSSENDFVKLTPEEKQLSVDSFQYIWETIRDKHFDPHFGGLNWNEVYNKFYPEINECETIHAARKIMWNMLDTLNLSHFNIIPSCFYDTTNVLDGENTRKGMVGIEIRVIDNHVYIFRLTDQNFYKTENLKIGYEILSFNSKKLNPILEKLNNHLNTTRHRTWILTTYVNYMLRGIPGDSLKLQFVDHKQDTNHVCLQFKKPAIELFQIGFMPADYVRIDTLTLPENTGYITFNAFLNPAQIMPLFNEAIINFMHKDGIIIDLRGNQGGILNMAQGMAAWFVSQKDLCFGTISTRQTKLKLLIHSRPQVYNGKLAILIDMGSACASECLACGLNDIGRARLFGSRSAGATLSSAIDILPNGDGFQYANACYHRANGQLIEGNGLIPDEEVKLTPEGLRTGTDPVIRAAINWIHEE